MDDQDQQNPTPSGADEKAAGADKPAVADDRDEKKKVPPAKKKRSWLKRITIWLFEGVAILVGIILLGLVALGVVLSRGPVDASFLLPHVEERINKVDGSLSLDIELLFLEWRGMLNPLGLEAKNVTLKNKSGPFMNIESVDFDLALRESFAKGVRLKKADIKGLSVRLQRQKDGSIRMFNEDSRYFGPPNRTTPLTISKVVENLPPIYEVSLTDARVSYHDLAHNDLRVFKNVALKIKRESLDEASADVTGFVSTVLGADEVSEKISLDFIFDGTMKELSLSGRLERANLGHVLAQTGVRLSSGVQVDVPLNARVQMGLKDDWSLKHFNTKAEAEAGYIEIPSIDAKNITIDKFEATLDYDPAEKAVEIVELAIGVDGMALSSKGFVNLEGKTVPVRKEEGAAPEKDNAKDSDVPSFSLSREGIHGQLSFVLDHLEMDKLDEYWPKTASDMSAYVWLVESMSNGRLADVNFGLSFAEKIKANDADDDEEVNANAQDTEFDFGDIWARFDVEGVDLDYNAPMAPAKDIHAKGRVDGPALTLDLDSVKVGELRINAGRVVFDDLVGDGTAVFDMKVAGTLHAAMSYLSADPINIDKEMPFDINKVAGDADLDVHIDFPTIDDLKVEQVNVKVGGTLRDVVLPKVLSGLSVTKGPFKITATPHEYRMHGPGRLEGRDVDLDWHSYMRKGKGRPYKNRIKASLTADGGLRDRLGIDLSDYVEGSLPVRVDYTESWNGRGHVKLSGELSRSTLKLAPFNFVKPSGEAGKFSAEADFVKGKIKTLKGLSIESKSVKLQRGNVDFEHFGKNDMRLKKAEFKRLRFGENNFSVRLEESRSHALKMSIDGAFLDAQPFFEADAPEEAGAANKKKDVLVEIGVKVAELRTTPKYSLKKVQGFIKEQGGMLHQLELDATVGTGALYVRYKPKMEDRYSLRIEADDAGAALKAFGVTDKVTGGKMTIAGLPLNASKIRGYTGDVKGLARIDNFNVRAAPALASLVKLMDLPTLMTSFNSKGLSFARLETEFEWWNRKGGGMFRLIDGRTSGGSLGLTFAGDVNKTEDKLHLSGTVVPASTLNSFFSNIPVVGQILSGGSDSIFAATYKMTGNLSDPKTNINPLSVLAPGFLRRVLFE